MSLLKSALEECWIESKGSSLKQSPVPFTLEPGFVSTADVVTAVDVSLTMLEGLWFICCLDIDEFCLENKEKQII